MKVLSISTDRNIFKKESAVRARMIEYGSLFDELHIIVFTNKKFNDEQISSNVWIYPTNSWSRWFYIRNAVRIGSRVIRNRRFEKTKDVITAQDPFETGLSGLKLKKLFGLPLHVQIHTDFMSPYFWRHSLLNWMRMGIACKVLRVADAVRVVSKRIKDSIEKKKLTKMSVDIDILPIFVDIKSFTEAPALMDLKKKYPQFNFIILMASRLTREKNIPLAFKMMRRLKIVYPKVGLVVVGEGREKSKLKGLAKHLGINSSVIFEPWQEDIASYYKTANMFLSTSQYEGYGLSMVEAIASHCPVVGTDAGIAPELLHDGEVSFVCPVGDAACLFENVNKLISDTPLRERFVHEAFARIDTIAILDKAEYLKRYKESITAALR